MQSLIYFGNHWKEFYWKFTAKHMPHLNNDFERCFTYLSNKKGSKNCSPSKRSRSQALNFGETRGQRDPWWQPQGGQSWLLGTVPGSSASAPTKITRKQQTKGKPILSRVSGNHRLSIARKEEAWWALHFPGLGIQSFISIKQSRNNRTAEKYLNIIHLSYLMQCVRCQILSAWEEKVCRNCIPVRRK